TDQVRTSDRPGAYRRSTRDAPISHQVRASKATRTHRQTCVPLTRCAPQMTSTHRRLRLLLPRLAGWLDGDGNVGVGPAALEAAAAVARVVVGLNAEDVVPGSREGRLGRGQPPRR